MGGCWAENGRRDGAWDRGKAGEKAPPAVTLIAIPRDNNGRRENSWAALCFSWVFVFLLVYFTFVCRGGVGIFTLVWFYYVFLWDRTGPHFPTHWTARHPQHRWAPNFPWPHAAKSSLCLYLTWTRRPLERLSRLKNNRSGRSSSIPSPVTISS